MSASVMTRPQQKRSEASLEKILKAARSLISKGTFDDAAITQIVDEAGLSVGAFYARFKDKEALFHVIQEQALCELRQVVSDRISAFEASQRKAKTPASLERVAKFIVDTLIALYNHSPGLIRAIYMHTRIKRDAVLYKRVTAFNASCIKQSLGLVDLVDARKKTDIHSAWTSAISVVGAFLREQLLFGDPMPIATPLQTRKAKTIATQMLLAFMKDQMEHTP